MTAASATAGERELASEKSSGGGGGRGAHLHNVVGGIAGH